MLCIKLFVGHFFMCLDTPNLVVEWCDCESCHSPWSLMPSKPFTMSLNISIDGFKL